MRQDDFITLELISAHDGAWHKLLFIILTLVFFYIAGIVPSFDCEVAKSSRKMWAFHTGDVRGDDDRLVWWRSLKKKKTWWRGGAAFARYLLPRKRFQSSSHWNWWKCSRYSLGTHFLFVFITGRFTLKEIGWLNWKEEEKRKRLLSSIFIPVSQLIISF